MAIVLSPISIRLRRELLFNQLIIFTVRSGNNVLVYMKNTPHHIFTPQFEAGILTWLQITVRRAEYMLQQGSFCLWKLWSTVATRPCAT